MVIKHHYFGDTGFCSSSDDRSLYLLNCNVSPTVLKVLISPLCDRILRASECADKLGFLQKAYPPRIPQDTKPAPVFSRIAFPATLLTHRVHNKEYRANNSGKVITLTRCNLLWCVDCYLWASVSYSLPWISFQQMASFRPVLGPVYGQGLNRWPLLSTPDFSLVL